MQNKSAALSNRCCGGTSCFRLTKLLSWRHKKVMVCVFFEVFLKQLLANVWLSSVLDIVEDPSLVSASTTPFQSSAGRSTSGMGQGPFVMDCGALEDVLRGARAGAILLKFFFLSFSCLPMPPVFWSMQAHVPELRQETGPTHDVAYQKENSLWKTCRMKCQAVCFKQRGCSMQIFNSPALQVDHEKVKKIPTQR